MGASARSIVLVGFMAAGKTTVGRLLAKRLQLPFVDTDEQIEALFGMPVAEIFRTKGERQFREAERTLISRLVDTRPQVIALGGGAFLAAETRAALEAAARTIWLDTDFELIRARLDRFVGRPLAYGKSDDELFALWQERREIYVLAELRIAADADPARVVERIISELA